MGEPALAGLRVLVVEDEFLIALDLEQLCREHGAREVVILRRLEDLESDDSLAYDAAVLDVMVSGRSTIEFALRLLERRIPFVFATGYSAQEPLFAPLREVTVIGKPFVAHEVIDAIVAAIRRQGSSGGV